MIEKDVVRLRGVGRVLLDEVGAELGGGFEDFFEVGLLGLVFGNFLRFGSLGFFCVRLRSSFTRFIDLLQLGF